MWKNIVEMLGELNKECNYLVLRNFESYEANALLSEHEDIDLLCDDVEKMEKLLHAERKTPEDMIHHWVSIDNKRISVDIRCIGDEYYDAKWEENMLKNRVLHKKLFYVMDLENYYYSLMYHALYHKRILREDYEIRLKEIGEMINIKFERKSLESDMLNYLARMEYCITDYGRVKKG